MKILIKVLAVLAGLWLAAGVTDCVRVTYAFQKPLFCLPVDTADDGGSGHYTGLGYSFDIRGRFLPDSGPADDPASEPAGVTRYTVYLFGREVSTGAREE